MRINNNKFRFGTIARIRPGIALFCATQIYLVFVFKERYAFPYFNRFKFFTGLLESIEKLNYRIKTKEVRKNV